MRILFGDAAMSLTFNTFADSWDAHIDLGLLSEIHYWSRRLGCSEQQLREAVHRVGRNAASVRRYLER